VHLIGNAGLTARYRQALTWWGFQAHSHDEALVTRGLFMLASALS
jgi:2-keto-3-deoxy-galactonokinase